MVVRIWKINENDAKNKTKIEINRTKKRSEKRITSTLSLENSFFIKKQSCRVHQMQLLDVYIRNLCSSDALFSNLGKGHKMVRKKSRISGRKYTEVFSAVPSALA